MDPRDIVLSRFNSDSHPGPVFLPDLRVWYLWHRANGSLPERWSASSLDDIYRSLEIPILRVERPWRVQSSCLLKSSETPDERSTTLDVEGNLLVSRWTRGPDGDWWQSEYPVKSVSDLESVLAYVKSRTFDPDLTVLDRAVDQVSGEGVVLADVPARPFSWLMLEMLGWSDGLMLLMDAEDLVREIVREADPAIQHLVAQLCGGGADLFYSPDNLDGHFVSPRHFEEYLAASYRQSARRLHDSGKHLLVHAGGSVGSLLPKVADAGIDGVVGICGPPQGDTPTADARAVVGDDLVLIGGIAQDHLLQSSDIDALDSSIDVILRDCERDPRIIASIADHLPLDADMERVGRIAARFRASDRSDG